MNKTISAGGVVVGPTGKVLVVNQDGRSWSLPKGHVDSGESLQAAAAREIREEAGITQLTHIKKLGAYERHRIGRDTPEDTSELKTIHLFLYTTQQVNLEPQDPRHPEARWVEPSGVADLLTHVKDKEFFQAALPEVVKVASGRGQ